MEDGAGLNRSAKASVLLQHALCSYRCLSDDDPRNSGGIDLHTCRCSMLSLLFSQRPTAAFLLATTTRQIRFSRCRGYGNHASQSTRRGYLTLMPQKNKNDMIQFGFHAFTPVSWSAGRGAVTPGIHPNFGLTLPATASDSGTLVYPQ